LCKELNIADYFSSIHGSPTIKNELVRKLIETYNYVQKETCLIGDSINDFEAASINNIFFMAFNNKDLDKYTSYRIF